MSTLIVVRHGQASFLSEDYDRLSALGWEQSRLLGRYWAAQGLCPTRIVVGPRKRHQETADALLEEMGKEGMTCPESIHDERLDEFNWDGLMAYANSTLSVEDSDVGALKAAFEAAEDTKAKRRTIQHYMEAVMERWATGAFHEAGLETWGEFCGRVQSALKDSVVDSPRGSRVALVTSGGVAAVTAGSVLGLAPKKTLGLIWTLRNGALVEYLYHDTQISLSAFNSAPHLPAKNHWTYR
ncbi:MAG: histidine phosphatase family protein [Candidatus Hydrogenedentes bacterium]|nr:histidine phosphatase family protein [Candidatus Hydrogenedentota bacterium]